MLGPVSVAAEPGVRLKRDEFFRYIEYQPHAGQAAVHASRARYRVLAPGSRWGKTTAAAGETTAALMEPRNRGTYWCAAPTYTLANKVFREVRRIVNWKFPHRILRDSLADRQIEVVNLGGGTSIVEEKTCDNLVGLLGEGLDGLVVDEFPRVPAEAWEAYLSIRLKDKRGWAFLLGTPKGKGLAYRLWKRGQEGPGKDPEFESWQRPSWDNPLISEAELRDDLRMGRIPERFFRQEYLGEFIEGADSVFRNVAECAVGEWLDEPEAASTYYGGLDLAKTEDYTVLTLVDREGAVVFADRFNRVDWTIQIQRIYAASERWGHPVTYVDSTGKGEPIFEALAKSGLRVKPYVFTQASKAALIDNLALMFERKSIHLPRPELWQEGIDELESFAYSVSERGKVSSGAPAGAHDDCVISLALAAWHLRQGKARPSVLVV